MKVKSLTFIFSAIIAAFVVALSIIVFIPKATADVGEVLGTRNPISGYSGPYKLSEGDDSVVWCLDYTKAEPMANGGVEYSEPVKIENVSPEDLRIITYALQEGQRSIEENNNVLAGAVAAVIHASGLNQGSVFDPATMVPAESRAEFDRIIREAPEVQDGSWLTARTPKDWKAGGSAGYQRVLDYDQIKTGIIEVEKKDAFSDVNLSGALFKIIDDGGQEVVEARETKDRPYRVQVNAGEYTVVEGRAPEGYTLNGDGRFEDNSLSVSVGPNEVKRVTFANQPFPELTINKVDDNDVMLPGAKIRVFGDNGDSAQFVSTDKPIVLKVRPGKYSVEEVEAPVGYAREINVLNVDISLGDRPTVVIVNKKVETEVVESEVLDYEAPVYQPTPEVIPVIPEIGTQAHIKDNNIVEKDGIIVDVVRYKNLSAGSNYKLVASTVCKSDGLGTNNVAELEFVAKQSEGVQSIEIPIVDDECKVQTVFEELYQDDELLVEHKDIDDIEQTVGIEPQPKKERIVIKTIPSGPVDGVHPDIFPNN